jgi:hypothetical protein
VKRGLFIKVVSAISLAFCAATATLAVRSYWKTDGFWRITNHSSLLLASSCGKVILSGDYAIPNGLEAFIPGCGFGSFSGPFPVWSPDLTDPGLRLNYSFAGFAIAASQGAIVQGAPGAANSTKFFPGKWEVRLPDWAVALPAAFVAMTLIRRSRRNRHMAGHCRRCGYDLRATPNRCPECGTVPPSAA